MIKIIIYTDFTIKNNFKTGLNITVNTVGVKGLVIVISVTKIKQKSKESMMERQMNYCLFNCLTDKEKAKAKRKGIRKAKIENRIAKIINWFSK